MAIASHMALFYPSTELRLTKPNHADFPIGHGSRLSKTAELIVILSRQLQTAASKDGKIGTNDI